MGGLLPVFLSKLSQKLVHEGGVIGKPIKRHIARAFTLMTATTTSPSPVACTSCKLSLSSVSSLRGVAETSYVPARRIVFRLTEWWR